MIPNNSPWIKQLKRTRPVTFITDHRKTDVLIVGGGIAGVVTAFFALRNTDKTVILLEANKIAHGATGHNAGQVVSYFERSLSDLVNEFGLEMAVEGQKSIESTWAVLEEIVMEAKLQTPLYRFTGYAGLSQFDQVLRYLSDSQCRIEQGLFPVTVTIAQDWSRIKDIPREFEDLYELAPKEDILRLLETNNKEYIAVLSYPKGCMNSALFTEELVGYLIKTYQERFSFFEESPMKQLTLHKDFAEAQVLSHAVEARQVVLCTNGFENFAIVNKAGGDIDVTFHHMVNGRVGYMSGYIQSLDQPPTAITYFTKTQESSKDPTGESYFYLTRRPYEHEGKMSYNLVCAGGPETVPPEGAVYFRDKHFPEDIRDSLYEFLRGSYAKHPSKDIEHSFHWHGLMGYTPNGIRRIGPEPLNPVLMYNLGCNGVGILPSIFGGRRIARFLAGEKVEPSIFDPPDQRN